MCSHPAPGPFSEAPRGGPLTNALKLTVWGANCNTESQRARRCDIVSRAGGTLVLVETAYPDPYFTPHPRTWRLGIAPRVMKGTLSEGPAGLGTEKVFHGGQSWPVACVRVEPVDDLAHALAVISAGYPAHGSEAVLKFADGGNPAAQRTIALWYENGTHVPKRPDASRMWLASAADLGDAIAARTLAQRLEGEPNPDHGRIYAYRLVAGRAGDAEAAYEVSQHLFDGRGVVADNALAAQWLRYASGLGFGDATFDLAGRLIFGDQVPKDPVSGTQLLRGMADAGDLDAQYAMGLWIQQGSLAGTAEDAVAWLRKAADGGSSEAQVALGRTLLNGIGVAVDSAAGYGWILRAANAGSASGLQILAYLTERGIGVAPDFDRAVNLYHSASSKRSYLALRRLGELHRDKRITRADPVTAQVFFELAVAVLREDGQQVPADAEAARAAQQAVVGPDHQAEVDKRVARWLANHPRAR